MENAVHNAQSIKRPNLRAFQLLAIWCCDRRTRDLCWSDDTYLESSTSYRVTVYRLLRLTRAQQPITDSSLTANRLIERCRSSPRLSGTSHGTMPRIAQVTSAFNEHENVPVTSLFLPSSCHIMCILSFLSSVGFLKFACGLPENAR